MKKRQPQAHRNSRQMPTPIREPSVSPSQVISTAIISSNQYPDHKSLVTNKLALKKRLPHRMGRRLMDP